LKLAILDLGTNTFNMLIANVESDKSYTILYKEELSVKLGEGGITKKTIAPLPFQRGIDALKKHKSTTNTYRINVIRAFATSAIRSAENGNDFVKKAFEETGINIQVIPGEEEAGFIYKGVKLAGLLDDNASLIMDIGGGSTEFIIAYNKKLLWKQSFDLGAARLMQMFKPSNPITSAQIEELQNYFDEILIPLFDAVEQYPVTTLIGCSGSFESFANMILHQSNMQEKLFAENYFNIELPDFSKLYYMLINSSEAERYTIKGLIAMRVDTIVYASIFVDYIIKKLNIMHLQLSHYALKEGVLYDIIQGDK
jgi:exopolyphosphatase/guanosine-5'-triphosphate,3'-diphosphate pyrophosphatase